MAASVSGTFRLIDRASPALDRIERKARAADRAINDLGTSLDGLEARSGKLNSTLEDTNGHLSNVERTTGRVTNRLSKARTEVDRHRSAWGLLRDDLRDSHRWFGRIDGALGSAGNALKKAGGFLGGFVGSLPMMVRLLPVILPLIVQLGGAVTALAASLTFAVGGAAVIGGGLIGALAVGFGSVAATAVSALKPLKDYQKAVEDLQKAQASGDPRKVQEAQDAVDKLAKASPGIARVNRELEKTGDAFKNFITARGRSDFLNFLSDWLGTGRRLLREFRVEIEFNSRAFFKAMDPLRRFFQSREFRTFIEDLGRTFRTSIGPLMKGIVGFLSGIAAMIRRGLPQVVNFAKGFKNAGENFEAFAKSPRGKRFVDNMIQSFKDWWALLKQVVRLVGALFGAARPAGDSLVVSLTDQLEEWTGWLQTHGSEVRTWFKNVAGDVKNMAASLGDLAGDLFKIADALRPITNALAGVLGVLGGPGALALGGGLLGARGFARGFKGAAGAGAARGAAGMTAAEVAAAGGAGAVGARGLTGRMGATTLRAVQSFQIQRALGAGRLGAGLTAGGFLTRAALLGAARIIVPLTLAMGAFGALSGGTGGRGVPGLTRNFLSGATAGLVPSTSKIQQRQTNTDAQAIAALLAPGGTLDLDAIRGRGALGTTRRQIRALEAQRAAAVARGERGPLETHFSKGGAVRVRGEAQRTPAQTKAITDEIDKEIKARQDLIPQLQAEKAARSRTEGAQMGTDVQRAFTINVKRLGLPRATRQLQHDTLKQMEGRDFPGARQIAQAGLAAAREAARQNPKLEGQYERLKQRINKKFSDMGHNVVVVGSTVLSATRKDWPRIRDAIANPAEKASERGRRAFTKLQQQAIGTLVDMGVPRNRAERLLRRSESSDNAPRAPRVVNPSLPAGSRGGPAGPPTPNPLSPGSAFGPLGDGPGRGSRRPVTAHAARAADPQRRATTQAAAAASPGGVTGGSKPGLGIYTRLGAQYGLHVSSGFRAGAITESGNQSYHATGDAVDIAGPPSAMLAFAQMMAARYGGQLEELIHTPLGFSIKNGQRVAPYAQADHYDHVHVADVTPGVPGAPGGSPFGEMFDPIKLARMKLNAGAPTPDVLEAVAFNKVAGSIEDVVNQRMLDSNLLFPGGGMTTAGGKYDKAALSGLWVQAGGDPGVSNLMAAIALAESGGNPTIANPSGATGLWQILGNPFPGNARDPLTNARMAVSKYRSQGLGAWVAYTNGNYRQFMGDAWGHDGAFAPTGDGWGPSSAWARIMPNEVLSGSQVMPELRVVPGPRTRVADSWIVPEPTGRPDYRNIPVPTRPPPTEPVRARMASARGGGSGALAVTNTGPRGGVHINALHIHGGEDTKRAVLAAFDELARDLKREVRD